MIASPKTIQGPDWHCVTPRAPWQGRDSQGYFVWNDHLWILGGWFSPQTPNPRDVWRSPDGIHWQQIVEEAPWVHSDMSACLIHRGKMWLMGGRRLPGAENSNEVWSSTDGAKWQLEGNAGWSPRVCHSYAVFRDRIWIMGGTENWYDDNEQTLQNDVWSTADGREWRLEVAAAPWSKRRDARLYVFEDHLWLIGGGSWKPETKPLNDVWRSADGIHWERVCEQAPWRARLWFAPAVYRNRLWLLGGWNPTDGDFNDIWCSTDGREWTLVACDVIWSRRHQPSAYVFDDALWIVGGHAIPVCSEVWSWRLPADWPEGETSSPAISLKIREHP